MNDDHVPPSRVFGAILMRDVTVVRRELPFFLLRTTLQPLLFVVVFGFVLPKMGMIPHEYTATVLPGVLALSLTLSAIQSVCLPMVQDFGATNEIEDRLLAPAPIALVAVEKVVAGTLQGVIAAVVVLPLARVIMGPIPGLTFANAGILTVVTLLSGAAFSAIGLFLGTAIPPKHIGLLFSVILGPMIMFGCTYYPWRGLDAVPAMKWGVLVNPLVYVSEGLRASLTPSLPHMNVWGIAVALLSIVALFTFLGLRTFEKRAMS